MLRANGIDTQIYSDDMGGMYPAPFQPKPGTTVYVKNKNLKKARELLRKNS